MTLPLLNSPSSVPAPAFLARSSAVPGQLFGIYILHPPFPLALVMPGTRQPHAPVSSLGQSEQPGLLTAPAGIPLQKHASRRAGNLQRSHVFLVVAFAS